MRTIKTIGLIVAMLGLCTALIALATEGLKLYRELPREGAAVTTVVTPLPQNANTDGPSPQFINTVTIPSDTNAGNVYTAPQTGTYIFQYSDSASAFWNGRRWATTVAAFQGVVPLWANSYDLDEASALFIMGKSEYSSSQSAIDSTKGKRAIARLNAGESITLLVGDGKTDYSDNSGNIALDIFLVP
jgi:hypothetical protein